ncbi:MAG: right-handed parallel beta-helix repeat-containing protein [Deltaproteobacteria bacterium]|nr:right-handed parallel beta-helix repeat-containing protein [Deltaproteobacteria bacterium]
MKKILILTIILGFFIGCNDKKKAPSVEDNTPVKTEINPQIEPPAVTVPDVKEPAASTTVESEITVQSDQTTAGTDQSKLNDETGEGETSTGTDGIDNVTGQPNDQPIDIPGVVFYVDINKGDDANSGAKDSPFKTIEKAKEHLNTNKIKGATVCIAPGKYYLEKSLTFTEADSGSIGSPNVYRGCWAERPVIKGSKKITAFNKYSDNIIFADLASQGITNEIKQVFLNGKRGNLARYPNVDPADPVGGGFLYVADDTPCEDANGVPFSSFKYKQGDFDPAKWGKPGEIQVSVFPKLNYWAVLLNVAAIDGVKNEITLTKGPGSVGSGGICANNRYFLQNIFEELDSNDEWYLDKNAKRLYFYSEGSADPNGDITVPVISNAVHINKAHDITFKDLIIEETDGYGIYIEASDNISIEDSAISKTKDFGIYSWSSKNITIDGCEIFETGDYAINIWGSSEDYKKLIPSNIKVLNNKIHDTSEIIIKGGGAISAGNLFGLQIAYNEIYNTPRIAISLSSNDATVEYNYVHDVNQKTQDTGAIYHYPSGNFLYADGKDPYAVVSWLHRGNIIRYNIVDGTGGYGYDSIKKKWTSPYYSYGIYLDGLTSGTQVYGNTVMNSFNAGIIINGGRDNIVADNTVINALKYAQISIGKGYEDPKYFKSMWNELEYIKNNPAIDGQKFLLKYPALSTITNDLDSKPEKVTAGNKIINNKIFYPGANTHLYDYYKLDAATTHINNNTISLGAKNIVIGNWGESKSETISDWQKKGFDKDSTVVSFLTEPAFNDTKDDYLILANHENEAKEFPLGVEYCGLEGNSYSGNLTLKPFESRILLSCYCNYDYLCNNSENASTCPNDCSKSTFEGLELDGTKRYIKIPDASSLHFSVKDSYTIEFLIKTSQKLDLVQPNKIAVLIEKYPGPYPFSIYQQGTNTIFNVYDGVQLASAVTYHQAINDGKWHHLAFVREYGKDIRMYIDGKLSASAPDLNFTSIDNKNPIAIGNRAGDPTLPFVGTLQDLRISKTALYKDDFTPRPYSAIKSSVGLWKMSDIAGTAVPDSSSGKNNGSIITY